MTDRPRVSCIMIFHQAEAFMVEAIESVFAQTVSEWELLLVDDGSTDGGSGIARTYAARHPGRVRYLQHPQHENRGMSASRNLGLAHARGELVAFLDADDVWLPHKLAMQTAILDAHASVDMVYGPSQYWYGWTGKPDDVRRDHFGDLGVAPDTVYEAPRLLAHALENGGATMPGICSLLVRRTAVDRVGGFEEAFRGCYEDQVFLFKIFLHAAVYVTGVSSDRYRQHPWSACAQASRAGEYHPALPHRARRIFLDWLRWYLAAEGVNDPAIVGPLERNLLPYVYPLRHGLRVRARWGLQRLRRAVVMVLRAALPSPVYRFLRARRHAGQWVPPVGFVRFGSLRRLAPVSRAGGAERGRPIDRHYVDEALARHADVVRGETLELGSDVLGARAAHRDMTVHMQVPFNAETESQLAALPDDRFDCIVCAHALQRVYDVRATVRALHRILKPGGVLLVTVPGAGSIGAPAADTTYWGFTALSVRRLFEEVFPIERLMVESRGSVLTATALLNGIAADELHGRELAHCDADYPVVLAVRAEKPLPESPGTWGRDDLDGGGDPLSFADDPACRKGQAFLDGFGTTEYWSTGVPLRDEPAAADCIFVRHVLEHDRDWAALLDDAVRSVRRRMVLVVSTPFATSTREIASRGGVPDLAFRKEDLVERFDDLVYTEESIDTATRYGREHVFYLERRGRLRAIAS